jgi:peptide/nickel transport system ATP-binding protein
MTTNNFLLRIENLRTYFDTPDGTVRAVDGVSLDLKPGETVGLVGESGCGKSVTAHSILRLLPPKRSRIVEGKILFQRRPHPSPPNPLSPLLKERGEGAQGVRGEVIDLVQVDLRGDLIRSIRGNEIAMIFQEPMTSLSPVHTIGSQIAEAVLLHQNVSQGEARNRTIEMLRKVGIGNAEQRFDEYPHQLSGGLRQRVMIAMALSCNPSLLIADEPTTALDVTIQAQILELMQSLQKEFGMAILIITHNLGVVAEMADRVAVMYMGKIVELADARTIFRKPFHPYTVGLLNSVPHMGGDLKQRLVPIPGSVPDPYSVPQGCAFKPRCPRANDGSCTITDDVALVEVEPGHWTRCLLR